LSAKAGALAFVAVLATGTAAAAATGSLPPGIQRAVSNALAHIAINVPHPGTHHDNSIDSHNGGTDGRTDSGGVAPGRANEPVAPRGVHHDTDDGTTPRGATSTKPGGSSTNPGTHGGQPAGGPTGPGTTNPNQGPGNNSGQHNGDTNGRHNGDTNGQHNGAESGNKSKNKATDTTPTNETTTTVKAHGNGAQNSNAGGSGTGSANSHASQPASGPSQTS
jgi:hypothetical protein